MRTAIAVLTGTLKRKPAKYITNGQRHAVYLCLFVCIMTFVITSPSVANPFTGGSGGALPAPAGKSADTTSKTSARVQPSPVRVAAPNQNLVTRQMELRNKLAGYFRSWKENHTQAVLWEILAVAFLYGVIHAVGPGHRKTVVFSVYLARSAPWWEPAGTGLLLSFLHGGAAIVLLLIFQGVSGAISGKADTVATYMEGFTMMLLIGVASVMVAQAVRELIHGGTDNHNDKRSLGAILISGIYPCPGAILILILSLTLGITGTGILAVCAMSLGMSIPIIASAYLAWFGRTGLFLGLKKNEKKIGIISSTIALTGYLVLLVFSVYIALPFIVSLPRAL